MAEAGYREMRQRYPSSRFDRSRTRLGYILLLPALLFIVLVLVVPILQTIQMSSYSLRLNQPATSQFIGLSNYFRLFEDQRFLNSIVTTLVFISGTTVGVFVLGLTIALVMNLEFRGRGVVRSALLIPWVMPRIIVAKIWAWMFNGIYGLANAALLPLGIISSNISWLNMKPHAMIAVQIAYIWCTMPFAGLLLLAGLQSIDAELYEAAKIDGASVLQRFGAITVPSLRPTIGITLIFTLLGAFKSFDLIFGMTQGGPMQSTETMMMYAYSVLFGFLRFGYGSSIIVMIVVLTSIISAIFIRGAKIDLGGEARI